MHALMKRKYAIIATLVVALMSVAAWFAWHGQSAAKDAKAAADAAPRAGDPTDEQGALSATQIERLGIQTEIAVASEGSALGSVPATVTLPPEARVAVTAPFAGVVTRLYVVTGQTVKAGQPLGVIRSREPVQYGAEIARAQARVGLAQATVSRTSQLVREGIVAASRADEAQAMLRQAQIDVAENRRMLSQSGAGANGETILRAPITGRLALVNVQTGGPVDGLTAPFVVENSASFMLDLQIPERLANTVFPGMAVEVLIPGGDPVAGRIIAVGSSIDPATRSILARARLAPTTMLVSGKSVMVVIKGASTAPGISIPDAAVTKIGAEDVVFVKTRNGFAKRTVTLSGRASNRAILSAGLNVGDTVATSGLTELKSILGGQ